jgi:hypothetical protein
MTQPIKRVQLIDDTGVEDDFYNAGWLSIRADGRINSTIPGGSQDFEITTPAIAPGAYHNFDLDAGYLFHLTRVGSLWPSWVRVYDSESSRDADNRSQPGDPPPPANSGLYAELATTTEGESVTLSPVPLVFTTDITAKVRVKNMDSVPRALSFVFAVYILQPRLDF